MSLSNSRVIITGLFLSPEEKYQQVIRQAALWRYNRKICAEGKTVPVAYQTHGVWEWR